MWALNNDKYFIQEKLIPRLTINPGLALTGFGTTRPLAERRISELSVQSCPRTQHYDPSRGTNCALAPICVTSKLGMKWRTYEGHVKLTPHLPLSVECHKRALFSDHVSIVHTHRTDYIPILWSCSRHQSAAEDTGTGTRPTHHARRQVSR